MSFSLQESAAAWGSDRFETALKAELRRLDREALPLVAAMSRGSHVAETPIDPVVLHSEEADGMLRVKVGIFFASINAGSCCADDPTPLCEENEYCEIVLTIDPRSGDARIER